jgi:hypothetical protein
MYYDIYEDMCGSFIVSIVSHMYYCHVGVANIGAHSNKALTLLDVDMCMLCFPYRCQAMVCHVS